MLFRDIFCFPESKTKMLSVVMLGVTTDQDSRLLLSDLHFIKKTPYYICHSLLFLGISFWQKGNKL